MTDSDWNRSQAKKLMHDHMFNGTPLPDVVIDDQLHIFFARVGPAHDGLLMTRAQIMMGGEQDPIEANKQLYRIAYVNIQRAMKDHAKRLGFGRHATTTTERQGTTTTDGNRSRGTSRERDRQDDRRSGFNFEHDSENAARVSGVRNEERKPNAARGIVSTRTGESRNRAATRTTDRSASQSRRKSVLKVKTKRSTVTPKRKR